MDLVLFLTYFFPPLGGGGVQRSVKFAKYLPEYRWLPIVVTVKPNKRNSIEQSIDKTGLEDIRSDVKIVRCNPIELSTLYYVLYKLGLRKALFEVERLVPFLHMDYKIGWFFPALKKSKQIIRRLPIKVIYSSSPPYSAHLAGERLHRLFRIPWVADFRDPWTLSATYEPRSKIHRYIDTRLELNILKNADVIIANTQLNKLDLLEKAGLDGQKVKVIPNGFDSADFYNVGNNKSSKFVISCIGKFYEMADSGVFFRAYHQFHAKHNSSFLSLIGGQSSVIRSCAGEILEKGSYEIVERVDHKKALKIMHESAVLLANLPGDDCDFWVPGKIYEYLFAKNPILFIGPKRGNAADIINKTGTGTVVGYRSQEILDALELLYDQKTHNYPDWHPDSNLISHYDRKYQTQDLANILKNLTVKQKTL